MKYKLNVEVIVSLHADDIDEAEEQVKNRFNTKNTKFYQVLEYTEEIDGQKGKIIVKDDV